MRPPLLLLCHRIPYPPNKGDKIRSYHLLQNLRKKYKIFLGAFIDDKSDLEYADQVKSWCEDVCLVELHPFLAKFRSLTGFLKAQPLTLPYYHDSRLNGWIQSAIAHNKIERFCVCSSSMAQYVIDDRYSSAQRIIDFIDVDSDKWRQYAATKPWPFNWVYSREAKYLLKFETKVASCFDVSFFVSKAEADLFRQVSPVARYKIKNYTNGVDSVYFSPSLSFYNPYSRNEIVLLFVGTMDYWPNIDAAIWFGKKVFPRILAKKPTVRLYIVGRHPTAGVCRLGKCPGVKVTGSVSDVRPYLKHAAIVVAPMRIGRGIQNKVLEGMAMAKSVIASRSAIAGLEVAIGKDILVADNEDEFYKQALSLLENGIIDIGNNARYRVCHNYNWDNQLSCVSRYIENKVNGRKRREL